MSVLRCGAESVVIDRFSSLTGSPSYFPKWSETGLGRAFCFDRAF